MSEQTREWSRIAVVRMSGSEDGVAAEARRDDGAHPSAPNLRTQNPPHGSESQSSKLDGNTWAVKAGVERLRRIAEAMNRLHATSGYAAAGTRGVFGSSTHQAQQHGEEAGVDAAVPGRDGAAGASTGANSMNSGGGGRLDGADVNELLRQQEENLRIIEEAFKVHVRKYQREKKAAPRTPRGSPDGVDPPGWSAGAGSSAPAPWIEHDDGGLRYFVE